MTPDRRKTEHLCGMAALGANRDQSKAVWACPRGAKIDDKRIKSLCATMYRIARKNCDTEEERRTVKRITPQQLETWGVITKVHGKWLGSNTYALLMGDPAFAIRLKCGLFKGNDKAVFLDRREFDGSVMSLIDEGISYLLAKINMGCYFNYQEFWIIRNLKTLRMATFPHPQCLRT